jgi:hypothetical protein
MIVRLICAALFVLTFTMPTYAHDILYVAAFGGSRGTADLDGAILRFDAESGEFIDVFIPGTTHSVAARGLILGPDDNLYLGGHRYDRRTGDDLGEFGPEDAISLAFRPQGDLYAVRVPSVSPQFETRIDRYSGVTGRFIATVASTFAPDRFLDIAIGADQHLYALTHQRILRYHGKTGKSLGVFFEFDPPLSGLGSAEAFTSGPDGDFYVLALAGIVYKIDGATGVLVETFINHAPTEHERIAVGPKRHAYITTLAGGVEFLDLSTGNFGPFICPICFSPDLAYLALSAAVAPGEHRDCGDGDGNPHKRRREGSEGHTRACDRLQ